VYFVRRELFELCKRKYLYPLFCFVANLVLITLILVACFIHRVFHHVSYYLFPSVSISLDIININSNGLENIGLMDSGLICSSPENDGLFSVNLLVVERA
jgi:hypothetical protein